MREQLRPGQQVINGRRERVLIGSTIDWLTHELLGGGIGDRADGHVGGGDAAGVIEWSGDAEVGDEHAGVVRIEVGNNDVGGLDVAVKKAFLMGVVQGLATAVMIAMTWPTGMPAG